MQHIWNEETNHLDSVDGGSLVTDPRTGELWVDEAAALSWLSEQAQEILDDQATELATQIIAVTTNVTGVDSFTNGVIEVDAAVAITATIEIQQGGSPIAGFTKDLRISIDGADGTAHKVVKVTFTDGVGTLTTSLPTGEFYITHDSINRRLAENEQMLLPQPITIVVAEV